MRHGFRAIAVWLTAASITLGQAERPPLVDLASTGELAVRDSADSQWRAVIAGEPVPERAQFQVSSRGGAVLSLAGGVLQIAGGTRGEWDLGTRTLTLSETRSDSGDSAIAGVSGTGPWILRLRGTVLTFAEDSEAYVGLPDATGLSVVLQTGKVAFSGKNEVSAANGPREILWNKSVLETRGVSQQRLAAAKAPWGDGARTRAERTGLGRLTARTPQGTRVQTLPISRQRVNLVLQPPVGLVQVDQSFFNPQSSTVEATFEFELPDGASVSRFAMFTTPTTLIEGELIPRAKADNVYTSIVRGQRDPAILEQIGRNLFRMRVFPIFAREHKRILLDYTVPLRPREEHEYEFRLPLSAGRDPLGTFHLTGAIPNAGDVQLASPTHPEMQSVADDKFVRFSLSKEKYLPESDLVLRFRQDQAAEVDLRTNVVAAAPITTTTQNAVGTTTVVTPLAGDNSRTYFMATVRPDVLERALPAQPPTPVDVLLVADTSGGQKGRRTLRAMLRLLTEGLPEGSRLRLGCLDASFRPLTKEWVPARSAESSTLLDNFDQELFLGGTSFFKGLTAAAESLEAPEAGRRRALVYIGDGLLPWGTNVSTLVRDHADLRERFDQAGCQFSAVHVGRAAEAFERLEDLAGPTGGRVFPVLSSANASSELFAWAQNGCPTKTRIESVGVDGVEPADLIVPAAWRRGEPLTVLGRFASRKELRLEVTLRGAAPLKWTLPVSAGTDYFVGRTWAQHRLERLGLEQALAQRGVPAAGAADRLLSLTAQMEQLSQEWTVLCPATAFLVLETEADYGRWGIDRKRRHTYWKPSEALEFGEQLILPDVDKPDVTLRQGFGPIGGWAPPPRATPSQVRRTFVQSLGLQRPWFDATVKGDGLPAGHLLSLLGTGFEGNAPSPTQPYAWRAKMVTPPRGLTLQGLRGWLAETTGQVVNLHREAFQDEGIEIDKPILPDGIRRMSLNGVLAYARLSQVGWWKDDIGLHLSTPTDAGSRLATEVYPVADLLFSTERTELSQLVNPLLDIELAAEDRFRKKLEQPVSLNYIETPARDILRFLAGLVDDNVVFDEQTLTDEGINLDAVATFKAKEIPLRGALQWVTEPFQLSAVVWNESLLITTATVAGNLTQRTRVYPTVGLLFKSVPRDQADQVAPQGVPAGGNFGAGGFGGFGGGLGFGGGGFGFGGGGGGQVPQFGLGPAGIGLPDLVGERDEDAVASDSPANGDEDPPDEEAVGLGGFGGFGGNGFGGGTGADFSQLIDLITTTIEPDMWDEVGGAGSVREFSAVPSLVMRNSDEVHAQTLSLFRQLRKLKPVGGPEVHRPLTLPELSPADQGAFDFGELIDVVTTVIDPDTWDEVGGAGSVREFAAQGALVVRQTREVHDEIRRLLTLLRRTRVAIQSGLLQEPDFDPFSFAASTATPVVTHLPDAVPLDQLPAPEPAELAALRVRKEPAPGRRAWIRQEAGQSQRTGLIWDGQRLEVDLDGRRARIDARDAAVDHAGLQVVDVGPWAESVRKILDGRLIWLPHRSNAELARLFRVKTLAAEDRSVTLQFVRWEDAHRPDTDLRGTFSRSSGLPTLWEARVDGQVSLRLRFDDDGTVRLENANGKEQARWTPEDTTNEPAVPLPPLAEGWGRRLVLGTWPESISPALRDILAAIGRADLRQAQALLSDEIAHAPDLPLWRLLRAWCHEQDHSLGTTETFVADLKAVVASRAGDLRAFALSDAFLSIPLTERAAIAALQPADTLTAEDDLRRVRIARRLKDTSGAIKFLEQAIRRDPAFLPTNVAEVIDAYFDARQIDVAVQKAEALAGNPATPVDVLTTAASALFRVGQRDASVRIFDTALARESLTPETRAAVLIRRAGTQIGRNRWRSLLEAHQELDSSDPQRAGLVATVFRELQSPELAPVAAELSREVADSGLAARLLWHEVDLMRRDTPAAAAKLAWDLYVAGKLPVHEEPWLADWLEQLGRHEDCIHVLEARLRAGRELRSGAAHTLTQAYRLTNRPDLALRAWTHSIELAP